MQLIYAAKKGNLFSVLILRVNAGEKLHRRAGVKIKNTSQAEVEG
jgi:hypothetical protein